MADSHSVGLEIDTDSRQQRHEWIIQRVAWVLLSMLLLAIAFGLLGRGGPLSVATVAAADNSLRLQYQRFIRKHSPDILRIIAQVESSETRISVDGRYLSGFYVEQVTPQPEKVHAENDVLTFVFRSRPGTEVRIDMRVQPGQHGRKQGWVALEGRQPLRFTQFVYP